MSHELRTPMAIVFGMLDALLLGYLEAEQREYIKIAQTSARSLLRILNDMLLMAQVEAGKLRIEENPFSLQDCITQAVDITTPEVHRKNLDFSLSVAEDVPDKVIGDKVKVRQVLLNLMSNAIKFTEEGKVAVRITVGKANADRKREFTFTVTDTGIGIPDDKKSIIFQPFIQADASPTRKFGGTGLGLAISREIVELMEGTISFESREGAGSSFSFTIPMESVVEKEEG
jgi:signal transduction histidine kinase